MSPCGNESCCTRPILSSILTVLTLAAFSGAICLIVLEPDEEKCKCNDERCCFESTNEDGCDSDECYCPSELFAGDVCRKKENERSQLDVIFFFVLIAIGILLIVVSSISCCCCAKARNISYQGPAAPVVRGIPQMEMAKA